MVATFADLSCVPVTYDAFSVIVSVSASPMVVLPVLLSVVNAPAAGAVPPMAGGLARYVLKPVPLTVLDADKVVNAPVEAVVAPIDMLLIVPSVPELIVIVPAPVVVYDCALVVVLAVTAPVAVSAVNVPARAVVAPIDILLIVPAVPELMVIVPAPVVVYDWLLVVVLAVTAPVADSVVNAPVLVVVAPIDILFIVPTPVEVRVRVGVVLAVSVIKFVYATPSVS